MLFQQLRRKSLDLGLLNAIISCPIVDRGIVVLLFSSVFVCKCSVLVCDCILSLFKPCKIVNVDGGQFVLYQYSVTIRFVLPKYLSC